MRFQVTERISTTAPITAVGAAMQANFQRIAATAHPVGSVLRVTSIQATFGSINRTDVTDITIKPAEDGYLLVAEVNYRPSVAFWIILIITLFTWVFWLIPIIFYLLQKDTVKRGIEEGFRNVKNELSSAALLESSVSAGSPNSSIADLEKLGALLTKGLITLDEFNQQKRRILGQPNTNSANQGPSPPPIPVQSSSRKSPPNNHGDTNEEQAARALAQARDCIKSGQKELAVEILRDILKRFPNTNAAAQARKSLAPRPKT